MKGERRKGVPVLVRRLAFTRKATGRRAPFPGPVGSAGEPECYSTVSFRYVHPSGHLGSSVRKGTRTICNDRRSAEAPNATPLQLISDESEPAKRL